MELSSNIEDYLETIILLNNKNKNKIVRVKDVSRKMSVNMASVHSALHTLKNLGLIEHENYGYIELTRKGKITGKRIYNTHKLLIKFLTEILGSNPRTAEKNACKMEHVIDKDTLKRLTAFVGKYLRK